MPLKDILTFIEPHRPFDEVISFALSLGGLCKAHVTAAALVPDPSTIYFSKELPDTVLLELVQQAEAAAAEARQRFEREAALAGNPAETLTILSSPGEIPDIAARLARHFDLSVVGQPDPNGSPEREEVLHAVLFGSGRPTLVVPYIQKGPLRLDHVIVAWDGSEVAARALGASMPLLHLAKEIRVVTIPSGSSGAVDYPGFNIARHLARHGLRVDLKVVPTTIDIGNTLLSLAADEGADLLVMGAYGHSRLREFVLGGATRVVTRTMTLPVLMAH